MDTTKFHKRYSSVDNLWLPLLFHSCFLFSLVKQSFFKYLLNNNCQWTVAAKVNWMFQQDLWLCNQTPEIGCFYRPCMFHKQHKYNHHMLLTKVSEEHVAVCCDLMLVLLNFTATYWILLSEKSLIIDTSYHSNQRQPHYPSKLTHQRLKMRKTSLIRPENTAKLLSCEYQISHEQHRIYTTSHENNTGMHRCGHIISWLLSQPGD